MVVVLASQNRAKVSAVTRYLDVHLPSARLICVNVVSGISPTPFSNEECLRGAHNRILVARQIQPDADLYIGAEGGVFRVGPHLMLGGWVIIQDTCGVEYIGSSCFVRLPESISEKVSPQRRLSDLIEPALFGIGDDTDLDEIGTNGVVTGGVYTRVMEFEDALRVAFAQMRL